MSVSQRMEVSQIDHVFVIPCHTDEEDDIYLALRSHLRKILVYRIHNALQLSNADTRHISPNLQGNKIYTTLIYVQKNHFLTKKSTGLDSISTRTIAACTMIIASTVGVAVDSSPSHSTVALKVWAASETYAVYTIIIASENNLANKTFSLNVT